MLKKRIITFSLLSLSGLSYAINVPAMWIEAYKQGKEDEKEKIVKEIKDLKAVIEGMLKFRYYLIAGEIPPPIVVEEKSLVSTPTGMKVVKKYRIYFPNDIDLSELEKIKTELNESYIPKTGYWVYIDISKMGDYAVGYLKFKLKQLNYNPVIIEKWLVAGIYQSEGNAKENCKRINSLLHNEGVLEDGENFNYIKID
jgi:hypothetical protein